MPCPKGSLGKPHLLGFQPIFKNLSEVNAKGTAGGSPVWSHWVGGVHGHTEWHPVPLLYVTASEGPLEKGPRGFDCKSRLQTNSCLLN